MVILVSKLQKLLLSASFYIFYNIFYHSDPDENLENKNQCKNFNLVVVTSNKVYFHRIHESFKCTANKHKESNFDQKFYLSTSLGMHG